VRKASNLQTTSSRAWLVAAIGIAAGYFKLNDDQIDWVGLKSTEDFLSYLPDIAFRYSSEFIWHGFGAALASVYLYAFSQVMNRYGGSPARMIAPPPGVQGLAGTSFSI